MIKEHVTTPPLGMVKLSGPYAIADEREQEMLQRAIRDLGKIPHAVVRVWGSHYMLYRSQSGFKEVAA